MKRALTILCMGALLSSSAFAESFTDYGTVLSVTPMVQSKQVETCGPAQDEITTYQRDAGPNDATAGAIVGGVLGGVLGHQVGGGRGKDIATVVGAIGGTLIGQDMGGRPSVETQRTKVIKCTTSVVDTPVGYSVIYSYQGRTFKTTTNYRPDRKIPLTVSVDVSN